MRLIAIPVMVGAAIGCMTHQHLGSVADDAAAPGGADARWQVNEAGADQSQSAWCPRDLDCSVRARSGPFDCSQSRTCAVTCEGDCRVACGMVPCRVTCPDGARCEPQCSPVPPRSCGDGSFVCNGMPC
jgi:hypothetical protein